MGQKVNPNGFRYGITKNLNSSWFAEKANYGNFLVQDAKIYKFFDKLVRKYQIGKVEIKRNQANKITVFIHSATPNKLVSEGGSTIDKVNVDLHKYLKNKNLDINLQVVLLKNPELNARLAAEAIAIKLENRESFRIAQKLIINDALKAGAKGIKTAVSGRLNGVDMARTEGYSRGEMRLHTLRQDVDYAHANAHTTYGVIGVKVWISKGEILEGGSKDASTKKN
ncbi:30S ribosomal protein S3 [Mycoplasmopsis caviae]|uniref:Small ribosomal subunit protein uS3 n=1 Tax=Mycoplasmopsis caviae TaxID=55603 RepID=A0A3P8LII7_9BACT|nr:30S ribosomal protein S3 [Mycoplasmopsis caviae]UUD34870.1 30S ribosomal protein S3 [Mycoplasmopsis caviae]VDR42282.1 30S ribosomal protein S3 [Mycoplasmopsis caviae]